MNFLGVGALELLAILLIMLVFAGPKRMIRWSSVLGQHVAKFRKIWSETVDLVQKEFDEAGVDIKLPKEPPTRKSLNRAVTDAVKPMTNPMQSTLDEVKKDLDAVKEVSDTLNQSQPQAGASPKAAATKPKPATARAAVKPSAATKTPALEPPAKREAEALSLGTWNGAAPPAEPSANGNVGDLGTWSKSTDS